MKENRDSREPVTAKNILIPLAAGTAIALAVLLVGGVPEKGTGEFWKKLCDACTVPGILLTGMGLLGLLSGQGAFDGMAYPVRKAFGQILSEKRRAEMPKTYYDYVTERQGKSRKKHPCTLWVGLFFLVLAGIALILYSRYDPSLWG